MNWSKYSLKALLTVIWNVGGPFLTPNVATLTLGSRLKQRLAKVQAKIKAWESHFMLMGV